MPDPVETGTVLLQDRYELLETLGAGGGGRVVKALDHQHARLVALKLRSVGGDRGRDDLLREATGGSEQLGFRAPADPAVDFTPDSHLMAIVDGCLHLASGIFAPEGSRGGSRCRTGRAGQALVSRPTVDVYDARSLRLVRHHVLTRAIETLVFSPDSQGLAVEDTSNLVRVWDTCAVCENPKRLSQLAAEHSVRELTPGERATFNVR